MVSSGPPESPHVPSVNYHVWQACNMRCRFCFATFQGVRKNVLPAGHLDRPDAMRIVRALARAGFTKINFAGGEPFLCPWLVDLVVYAKKLGMVTSVVTNGSYFDRSVASDLLKHLDWLVLSVDSLHPATAIRIGRVKAHKPISKRQYLAICERVHAAGVNLKINTVVTSANYGEDFRDFIIRARPRRWKIMQMLPLQGPDSRCAEDLIVDRDGFNHFVAKNRRVRKNGIVVVPETSSDMVGSYAMIDPAGRFYDNVSGQYKYSQPILDVGVRAAFSEVDVSAARFLARDGLYDFWGGWKWRRVGSWAQLRGYLRNRWRPSAVSSATPLTTAATAEPVWLQARISRRTDVPESGQATAVISST
ncbi:viperin family antiviral radical SAM protein [Kibdelosporangium aridum]|uniref:viperin family antiviral radical SAM protein n=1 Tax=Kibdelosporangium aridum TaxID=2030 RepID=UPI0035E55F3F